MKKEDPYEWLKNSQRWDPTEAGGYTICWAADFWNDEATLRYGLSCSEPSNTDLGLCRKHEREVTSSGR